MVSTIQLIGVSIAGLEPEFQPVANHLLPQIIAHRQDSHDMHLQVKNLSSLIRGIHILISFCSIFVLCRITYKCVYTLVLLPSKLQCTVASRYDESVGEIPSPA